MTSVSLIERFMSKVAPPNDKGCREWTAGKLKGYGLFSYRGKTLRAHVMTAVARYGPVPAGLEVCHTCHNPSCVNPDHLYYGTHLRNMQESSECGSYKDRHTPKKLTEKEAREILYSTGALKQVASRYGVSCTMVGYIRRGHSWKHIRPVKKHGEE